jgi:4-nitrophenyl phosphatase
MRFKACILDIDGVLALGDSAVEGAGEALKKLRGMGLPFRLITNNSTKSRRTLKKRLFELGISVSEEELITSGSGTATYLREHFGGGKVFMIGEEGLSEELDRAGFDLVSDEHANFVVVGLDRNFTYNKLAIALKAIRNGARFIATNEDATLPVEYGALPGAGAMVASLIWCAQKKPELVIGKPAPYLFEEALKELGAKAGEVLAVGDRIETDILGGNDMGFYTVLVLTGASNEEDAKGLKGEFLPKLVLKSIAELPERIEEL